MKKTIASLQVHPSRSRASRAGFFPFPSPSTPATQAIRQSVRHPGSPIVSHSVIQLINQSVSQPARPPFFLFCSTYFLVLLLYIHGHFKTDLSLAFRKFNSQISILR